MIIYKDTTLVFKNLKYIDINFVLFNNLDIVSTKVLDFLDPSLILCRLLKNCVGQINSTNEQTMIYFINK